MLLNGLHTMRKWKKKACPVDKNESQGECIWTRKSLSSTTNRFCCFQGTASESKCRRNGICRLPFTRRRMISWAIWGWIGSRPASAQRPARNCLTYWTILMWWKGSSNKKGNPMHQKWLLSYRWRKKSRRNASNRMLKREKPLLIEMFFFFLITFQKKE